MSITWAHRETLKEKVSPRDCALLIGIPLDEQSFHAKYSGPRDGSFAQSVVDGEPESAWSGYSTLMNSMARSIDDVEGLGVRVYRSLTPETLAKAIEHEVVTIATQWRSAEFMLADVLNLDALREELGLAKDAAEDSVVGHLNDVLRGEILPCGEGMGASTRRQMELIRCRVAMEQRLRSRFRGGAGIEFSDGFRGVAEVAGLFPASFDRIVDLSVCNSLALTETIRRRCSGALAIAMGDVTRPHIRFPLYVAVVRLLQRNPEAYDIAVQKILTWFEGKRP